MAHFLIRSFPLEGFVGRVWHHPAENILLLAIHTILQDDLVRNDTRCATHGRSPQGTIQIVPQSIFPQSSQFRESLKGADPGDKITLISLPPRGKITVPEIFFLLANTVFSWKDRNFPLLVTEFLRKMLTYDLVFGFRPTLEHFIPWLAIQRDNQTSLFARFQKGASC